MEPSAEDILAVSQVVDQPAAQPTASTAQPVAAPTAQPTQSVAETPTTEPVNDPFAAFAAEPTQSTEPTQPTPAVPTEPIPAVPTEVAQTPTQPAAPVAAPVAQPVAAPTEPSIPTADEYIESIFDGLPEMPAAPDASQVNADSAEDIQSFFDNLMATAEKRFEANYARKQAIQTAEKRAWDSAFAKYPSLQSNAKLRDMVHAIRMSAFNKGQALSPTQAAENLLAALGAQYRKGVADNQVQTTITSVQPQGGGSTAIPTTLDSDNTIKAVQEGGEAALAEVLDKILKA